MKRGGGTGAGGVPDQYLPWQNGLPIRVAQGNQSPCGWTHSPPRCNSIGAYTQYGWDFLLGYGAPVHAPAGGVVRLARGGCNGRRSRGCNGGYGNTVTIEVPTGNCERFEHLSRIDVHPGQAVAGYDVIGAAGNSGNSTGTHLHYQREVCAGRYAGIAIPSSFIEAGVPRQGQVVTSRNHTGGTIVTSYYVLGPSGGLDVRSGPGTNYGVVSHLAERATVTIACQTRGTTVGNSSIWDNIGPGAYVPDFYISTPGDGVFSPGLTVCPPGSTGGSTGGSSGGSSGGPPGPPSLDGGAHDTSFEHQDPFPTLNGGTNQAIYCGDGQAHDGNCYLEVNGSSPGNSFVEDFSGSPAPGQCYQLSAWLRSRSAPTFSGVLAIWVRNFHSDQSASTAFTVGQGWTPVTVTMRTPSPPSGPPWSAFRGQLYLNTTGQNLDWDLTRWFGPFSC